MDRKPTTADFSITTGRVGSVDVTVEYAPVVTVPVVAGIWGGRSWGKST